MEREKLTKVVDDGFEELLELGFKGARDYIQGGDIFNSAEVVLNGVGFYTEFLSLKKMTSCHLIISDRSIAGRALVGVVRAKRLAGDDAKVFYLQEADHAIDRRAFPEELISDRAIVNGDCVCIGAHADFTVIENIIAANKKLCYAISPLLSGRWVFAQLLLKKKLPMSFACLRLVRSVGVGSSFSKSNIFIDDELFGEVVFCVEGR